MATNKIRLVQGDTAPQLQLSLTDERTRRPLDLSTPGTTARLLFREVGADGVKATMPCFPIAGYVDPDTKEVDYRPPYDVAGRAGGWPWTGRLPRWTPPASLRARSRSRFPTGASRPRSPF